MTSTITATDETFISNGMNYTTCLPFKSFLYSTCVALASHLHSTLHSVVARGSHLKVESFSGFLPLYVVDLRTPLFMAVCGIDQCLNGLQTKEILALEVL